MIRPINLCVVCTAASKSETKYPDELKLVFDELVNVKFIKRDLAQPYKIQFEGNFQLESFASHGIILIDEKIFKVRFSC